MKKLIFVSLIATFFACENVTQEANKTTLGLQTKKFDKFKESFVAGLWKQNPLWATSVGFHDYDHILPLPNEENARKHLHWSQGQINELSSFQVNELTDGDKVDFYLIKNYLESQVFYEEELKSYCWDPSEYNLGGAFFEVINYREKSLEKRLEAIYEKLNQITEYYVFAKQRLENPTLEHTQLAIQQLEGSKRIFQESLLDSLHKSSKPKEFQIAFTKKVDNAILAIDQFIRHLQNEILPKAETNGRSFRIGKELFEKKFAFQIQSNYSAQEIFEAAVEEKSKLHDQMFRLSEMLWEKYFQEEEKPGSRLGQIKMLIDEVAKKYVNRDSFLSGVRQQIPQLEKFVKENNLLSLDTEKPLVVRETPAYMRGFAGASISAPGPYDKNAETYYNVTPLDHYTEEEAESYLKEYNHYVLQILNIHEAIPGHYTQLVYSNQSPSIVKSILGNGAMIEGWAVYAERMMLEAGYGGEEMEMGLMYYKWNLRTVCNTILDYGVHVNNFTQADAMHLLMKEAFQEKAEAMAKWKRARISQVQLSSYFAGYYEIMQLRDERKLELGEKFELKTFHEQFLSYGSAPVKYIRLLMLNTGKNIKEEKLKKAT